MWNLTLVCIVSLNDPPRHNVDLSVQKCRAAGIKVIMVTGDQTLTAASIAEQIGIIDDLNNTQELIRHKLKDMTLEDTEKVYNELN